MLCLCQELTAALKNLEGKTQKVEACLTVVRGWCFLCVVSFRVITGFWQTHARTSILAVMISDSLWLLSELRSGMFEPPQVTLFGASSIEQKLPRTSVLYARSLARFARNS